MMVKKMVVEFNLSGEIAQKVLIGSLLYNEDIEFFEQLLL